MTHIDHTDSEPRHQADHQDQLAVTALTAGEALLVWGTRYWVHSVKQRRDPRSILREGFRTGTVEAAVDPLDELLTLTLNAARSPRDVRCPKCKSVGDGERDILLAVAIAQNGTSAQLHASLGQWLHPSAIHQAAEHVHGIASALESGGLILPCRVASGPAPRLELANAEPASRLIH